MKFTIPAGALRSAINSSSSVTPTRSATLVAYTGVHLEVSGETLTVTGSDGEVTVSMLCPVTDASPGFALVQPKRLAKWLSNLDKEKEVTLSTSDGTEISAKAGPGRAYRFRTMVATFPVNAPSSRKAKAVDLSMLRVAVASVRASADEVSGGSTQQAVQVVSSGGNLTLHSTDRLRLSRAVMPGAGADEFVAVVEIKALEMADRLGSTRLTVEVGGKSLLFEGEDHRVVVRSLEVQFPPVDMILKNDPSYKVAITKASLKSALDRLECVSEEAMPLLIEIDGEEIALSTESAAVGGGREVLHMDSPAPASAEIGVNLGYLLDAVNSCPSDDITIGWTTPVLPLFVQGSAKVQVTGVVMPIKLSS